MRTEKEFVCLVCKKMFKSGNYKSKDGSDRKFCSRFCSGQMNKQRCGGKHLSEEHKNKIGESVRKFCLEHPENRASKEVLSKAVGMATKGRYNRTPKSILEFSKRTISKILNRIKAHCSHCGWNEGSLDVHHIRGRKIENADAHNNLSCLCPNCHRLTLNGKLKPEDVIPISIQFGDKLFDYYYG